MLLDQRGMGRELLWAWLRVMAMLVAGGKTKCGGEHIPRRAIAAEERAADIMVKVGVKECFDECDRIAFRSYGGNVV